jgi:hypothetical protein
MLALARMSSGRALLATQRGEIADGRKKALGGQ